MAIKVLLVTIKYIKTMIFYPKFKTTGYRRINYMSSLLDVSQNLLVNGGGLCKNMAMTLSSDLGGSSPGDAALFSIMKSYKWWKTTGL